jgi:phosphoribosyl-ATP pyrophosphohydrolase
MGGMQVRVAESGLTDFYVVVDIVVAKDTKVRSMSSVLEQLAETIENRKQNPIAGSYTAKLFSMGENEILKKIGEEAIEVIVAAKSEGDERVIYEMADMIYHSMVLLSMRGLDWKQVEAELARRMK